MGQHDIRRLLIIGAMSVVQRTLRKGAAEGSWLARRLAKTPRLLLAIALANRMARGIRAMITKNEDDRGGQWQPDRTSISSGPTTGRVRKAMTRMGKGSNGSGSGKPEGAKALQSARE